MRRLGAFVALAVFLGAVFVRLGLWQLDRRAERRAANYVMAERLAMPPVNIVTLLRDSAAVYRRATVRGEPDYANEVILAGRSRSGSPGVHVLTPVQLPGRDTAVIVNRGWIYSPDAATVDLNRWREPQDSFAGYTARLPDTARVDAAATAGVVRQLSHQAIARMIPYPVHPVYLVAQDSSGDSTPARLPTPLVSDGPHLSYAIQWFCFAAIAVIGAAAVVIRARRSPQDGATGA